MQQKEFIEIPFDVQMTLYYSIQAPEMISNTPPLLVALHGWGQRSTSIIRSIAALRNYGVFILAPQAPHQFYVDAASKKVGCNWITAYQKEQSIRDINRYLDSLIAHIIEQYDLQKAPVFLFGFSQGASVAYRFAVSGSVEIAGLIACGADVPPDVIEKFPARPAFPVLLAHGRDDNLVPETEFEANQSILRDAQYPHEVFLYEGGHEITPELCRKVGEWLGKRC